jgi:hypothetical protein
MFSEATVFSNAREAVLLKTQLVLLKTALIQEKNPIYETIEDIDSYLKELNQSRSISTDQRQILAVRNNYAGHLQSADQKNFTMFKAGVWFFDYALAALAHDGTRLRQSKKLQILKNQLSTIGAPVGVIRSIDKMVLISNKGLFKSRDYAVIVREVENIRNLLG